MKAIIVFESTHGCTEKCAGMLKEKLQFDADIIRLKEHPSPDLDLYEIVIIGGSIHAGEMNTRVKKFCEKNLQILLSKKLGLYICCMHGGELALNQFEKGFPEKLRNRAEAIGLFGGEFNFSKMNFFEKAIVKKVAKVDKSVSKINMDEVILFAEKINKIRSR